MAVLTKMVGFVTTTDPQKARSFYGDVLGFRLIEEDDYALVYDANGTMIRVGKAREFEPAQGTILGWEVEDVHAAIRELVPRGVRFEQWGLPFMKQDEHGVWTPPNGDRVAWFKDPEGNVLSISQHAGRPSPR
jgi:catechol 2,3-dioxygenase-like lactoylglutathione lyase family enzyme